MHANTCEDNLGKIVKFEGEPFIGHGDHNALKEGFLHSRLCEMSLLILHTALIYGAVL